MNDSLKHVAIIMDGNGRWAKKNNKPRSFGHLEGTSNVRNIAIEANDLGIEVLTLYAFSTENWSRPLEEVNYLMQLPAIFFKKYLKELMEKNIKISMIGEFEQIPKATKDILQKAIKETQNNTGMVLNFAMNYGGQREIALAAKQYAEEVQSGKRANDLTEKEFSNYLMTKDFPPVDLLIRTSYELRISNFLLWQIAYAELMFIEESWPEFTPERFREVIHDFLNRERRFGGIGK